MPVNSSSPRVNNASNRVFFTIVVSQFCGTSLWFAGNAILPRLQETYGWSSNSLGYLTSSTQIGFIIGTLVFAIKGVTDKFPPTKIFFISSLIAAATNLLALVDLSSIGWVVTSRLFTGFFLAGIYPVGMKVAADWKKEGLGHWLGSLVGALVLGTSFPHVLKVFPAFVDPQSLIVFISALCVAGGFLMLTISDGPYRKAGGRFSFSSAVHVFSLREFRRPSLGYFGHMWELYALWAFVPWALGTMTLTSNEIAMLSFMTIAAGAIGCVAGGVLSRRVGSARVATVALFCSGLCCLLSPAMWSMNQTMLIAFLIFWGITVAADSPQFSALVAASAPAEVRGSAITLVICIGFSITIVSIQLLNFLQGLIPDQYMLLLLLPGPVLGVLAMRDRGLRIADGTD